MKRSLEKNDKRRRGDASIPHSTLSRVVVVGGGFAGMNLVKKLRKSPFQVILVDRNNFHLFLPLLYQVATSGLEPHDIVFPYRKVLDTYHNVVFRMAEVYSVDPEEHRIKTSIGDIDFDFLVLANGSSTNFFGNDSVKEFANGLKSVPDAMDVRYKLLENLEKATVTTDRKEKEALCRVVVVGGGPTGVEIAGALAEFKRYVFPTDYPELKDTGMKIYLVEAAGQILQDMPAKLSDKALKYLTRMEVEVILNAPIESFDGSHVQLGNDRTLETSNLIWTAGVKAPDIKGIPSAAKNKQNRIKVDEYNRVLQLNNVFAIGDLAVMETEKYPKGHPLLAQAAIQQGKTLAGNLENLIKERPLEPFRYIDKGSLAAIGKKKAVASFGKYGFGGFFAWLIWSAVHLMSIMGARNKMLITLNWLWSYINYDKSDRVIIKR